MRILVVSPYPPVRDGIAAYALQSVARLRRDGHVVDVLSPYPSAAHHHLELGTMRGTLGLIPYMRRYDTVIVNYHPDVFFRATAGLIERQRVAAALAVAWRAARDLEVRVHEADYSRPHRGLSGAASRAMWRSAKRIVVHTETERNAFHAAYGLPLSRISVAAHGGDFAMRTAATRQEARARLGIPEAAVMFLAIGFIQPHKGFDRAVRAFAALRTNAGAARLDIVGSVRVEEQHYVAYLEELRALIHATEDAHLHLGFISDEQFDAWIVAADAVVLPYRYIWSSGVLERAALYHRPVIATRVGGLADQARDNTVLVDSDEQLTDAMQRILAERGVAARTATPPVPWPAPSKATRQSVMRAVRVRAAAGRGPGTTIAAEDGALRGAAMRDPASSAPLRRMPPLQLPAPVSRRPGVTLVKRAVQRLTRWELDPIVQQLNELQRTMADTLERRQ
jgi:glycosyltransferase involved in cell wall biosynthesis